jgi:nicotinamide mononucleotide transporter
MENLYFKPEKRIAKYIKDYAKDWNLFEKIWLSVFTLINIYLFFAWKDTLIGLITSLTGMICVVLVAKGKISNYYFGIINVALYAYIAFQSKYYGEVMLNALYFLPMQFIGLYYWKKYKRKGKRKDGVSVKHLSLKEKLIWASFSILGVFFYGLFLKYLGGTLPFIDSSSTILSIIAMILMVKRVTEQWILWITIDVVSIYMWFYILAQGGNEISMLVMWTAYLVNAIYGYYNWRKLEKIQNGN